MIKKLFFLVSGLLISLNAASQCAEPVAVGDTVCNEGALTLYSTGAEDYLIWYNSNGPLSVVGFTDTFHTPVLTTSTDYFVAEFDTGTTTNALAFDGSNDYVAIDNFSYAGTAYTEVTVEAWIRTTDGGNQIIVSYDRSEYWRFEINGEGAGTGQIAFEVLTDAGQHDFGGTILVNDGLWHHVAGVFDNGTSTVYVDGVLDDSATVGTTFGTGVTRYGFVGVGSEASTYNGTTGPNNYFNGDLAEIRVWNRALSQAEIISNMNRCLLNSMDSLWLYYRMDGVSGDASITDYSTRINDGFLFNMDSLTDWINTGPSLNGCPNCYSTRDSVRAQVDLLLRPNLGLVACVPEPVVLDAGPNYSSYLWNTGATTQTILASADGNYSVLVDSAVSICTGTDDVDITIISAPVAADDTAICGTQEVTSTVSGSTGTYYWYDAPIAGSLIAVGSTYVHTVSETDSFFVAAAVGDITTDGISFDGINDYIALDMSYNSITALPQLTVEAWVRTTVSGAGEFDNWSIVDFDRSEYFNFFVAGNNGRVAFATRSNSGGIHDFYTTSSDVVNDGNWHHIAGVYNGTDKFIYIDGVLVATALNPHSGAALGSNNLRFGFLGDGSEASSFNATRNNNYYQGSIDEVRIWSTARTTEQIAANRDVCLSGLEPSLEAYYKMNDGTGSTVLTDYSGNNHDGELFNMDASTVWLNDAPSINCLCGESFRDTVIVDFSPAITGSIAEVSCPGNLGTAIKMQGANGSGNFDYRELAGGFSYSGIFQATPVIEVLANGGTYNIEIQDENGCLDTLSTVVTEAAPTTISASTAIDSCNVFSGGDWYYIKNASNQVIAAVQSTGDDLGMVIAQVNVNANASVYSGEAYMGRSFVITPENQPTVSADLRLYFTAAEYTSLVDSAAATPDDNDDVSAISDLGSTKYNGPTEDDVFDPSDALEVIYVEQVNNGTQFGQNYIDITISSFSEFWINASQVSAVLPLEWLSFTANASDKEVLLRWTTAAEVNTSHFEIEHSQDGETFTQVGTTKAMNRRNVETSYEWIHAQPFKGLSYYRIKQVDLDGKFDYSETRMVDVGSTFSFEIFPNPNNGMAFFIRSADDDLTGLSFELFDQLGTKIEAQTIRTNSGEITLDHTLSRGVYFVKIKQGNALVTKKMVVR